MMMCMMDRSCDIHPQAYRYYGATSVLPHTTVFRDQRKQIDMAVRCNVIDIVRSNPLIKENIM